MRYVEGIDTIPNTDADNALILGTALHTGIEEGVEQALDFYKNSFPVLTDDHIHEMMKLEAMIPKAKAMLPPGGTFELPIGNGDFIGFMDYLVPVDEDLSGKTEICDGCPKGDCDSAYTGSCPCGKFTTRSKDTFDLYDFKYSNNAKNYAVSGQLHEYKYWYELTHPGHRIRNMYFLIVPKPKIRQKSTETLSQFRDRLQAALKDAEPTLMPVQYNPMKIVDFLTDVKHMVEATDFPKNPNHFCGWCEYEEYCQKGWDYMLLPKNERRDLNATKKKVVWLYGAPFSGKTFFANQFPDPLMLNTDGNIKFVDAPYIAIRDTVTVEGRITKRKLAYEVFTDAVTELEKKQNDFRTIVVDLLEDVYESCRVYICDRQGWKHESDDSFRAWDKGYTDALGKVFNKRFYRLLKYVCEDALNGGIGWLYPYYNEAGELSFKHFPAYDILPFWADDDHTILDCAIRYYTQEVWNGYQKEKVEKVEIFKADGIYRYIYQNDMLIADVEAGEHENYFMVEEEGQEPKGFNWTRIPLVPFKYNKQEIPLIRRVKTLQDGINTMISDFENNMQEDARNTILVLKNYDGENLGEFRHNLSTYGAVKVREDGGVETLQVEINAENYKGILELLKKSLIENARGYDAKDDRLSGNPNQMNIQSMYSDIDLDANGMETEFQAAFEELLWFINQDFSNRGLGDYEGAELQIVFNRDILINETESIENCSKSVGILSTETIVEQHPWVTDVEVELARLRKEKDEAMEQAQEYAGAFQTGNQNKGDNGEGE